MSNKTYTLKSQADFEALLRLPRPSTFVLSVDGPEGALIVSALLSVNGEVWGFFPHEGGVIFRIPSYEGLISHDLDYKDVSLELISKLFGHD